MFSLSSLTQRILVMIAQKLVDSGQTLACSRPVNNVNLGLYMAF